MGIGMIVDIAVVALFIISLVTMAKKGFIKALYSIGGHILAFVLSWVLLTPATDFLAQTDLGMKITDNVSSIILQERKEPTEQELENTIKEEGLAPAIQKSLLKEGISSVADASVTFVTDLVLKILTAVILFLLLRVIIYLVFMFLDTLFNIPVLAQLNMIAGAVSGILNACLIIFIVCAVVSLNFEWANDLRGIVDQTTVLKYFYINNLLVDFFIR